ncbi:mucosal addressin cell adhesion molecule 1 [Loxodonta africana]|uniref:mucosal addressin cell adhesion molecule 1 n=1 Tax=Loxodonta africana TaxID=9785 RepID=UPI0030CD6E42
MERGLALLLLCLGLLLQGRRQVLEVEPPGPEVAVAVGESLQLTCRLACPNRSAASVQWRGLDTSLGAVQSAPGSSVLSVRNASLSAAGIRVCVGSCGKLSFQRTVQLLVYAFPDKLSVSPTALVRGQDQEVACTAHNVTLVDSDSLSFALLLGDRELEGAQALDWDVVAQEDEEPLFHVTRRWLLPPLGDPAPPHLHCQATMRLPGLELSHHRAIPVLHSLASSELPASTTLESPTTTAPEPPTSTTQEQASTPGSCHPEILQPPMSANQEATWDLLCEVACGPPGVAVHWTEAPGGLAAYKQREAGARAWLSVQQARCAPRGWFQCRADPGGKMTSLYVDLRSSPDPVVNQPSAALWTGTLVLGLLLLTFLAYRLQKHCRSLG